MLHTFEHWDLGKCSGYRTYKHTLAMFSCVLEQDTRAGVLISYSRYHQGAGRRVYNTFPQAHCREPWGREQGAHALQFNSSRLYIKWCFTNRLKKQTRCCDLVWKRCVLTAHSQKQHSLFPINPWTAARKACFLSHSQTKFGNPDLLHVTLWISHPLENLEGQGTNSFQPTTFDNKIKDYSILLIWTKLQLE